jgi:alkanesulfonate monooxygenase SsuD/methylene tetrahydromethanopterin reductase-like flavin-dependent oxidoreductase (luciferase family)
VEVTVHERRRLSFGIKTSQAGIGYDDICRLWQEADSIDVIEHAWLWDHMVPLRGPAGAPALEAWTLLSALAAQTKRLRLGVIVTNNQLRRPTLLAKMAATVDIISGGRLEFGLGAGAGLTSQLEEATIDIVRREYDGYGVPIIRAADAVGALAEACTLIRRMWSEAEPFDFDGKYYQLSGTVCEPKPVSRPHPPITIGGAGQKLTLRVVAEHADIWNCPARTPEEFRQSSAVLDQHCAAVGRDPDEIARSVQLILRDDDLANTRDQVQEFIDAGVNHVVLAPLPPFRPLADLATNIIEPALARIGT